MVKSNSPAILVTGGAGYIGSHTAKALFEQGYTPVVYDNLSTGHRAAVCWGPFVHGDIRDGEKLRETLREHDIKAVIHFAGRIEVGRSMARPDEFFDINVNGLAQMLAAARHCGVERIVFSSSAAVYGQTGLPATALLTEDLPKAPTSCYGETKLVGEWMLADHCRAFGLSAVALRYFNACGADPGGLIGEAHEPETHLIPLAIEAALGLRPALTVFGTDFATPDGSCLRDYIHVCDLAAAHVAALRAPLQPGDFEAVNVGAGQGRSVLQVIEAVAAATGRPVPHAIGARRDGDPPSLVADPGRATRLLGWRAERSDLAQIVRDAAAWHRHPKFGPHLTAAQMIARPAADNDAAPAAPLSIMSSKQEGVSLNSQRSDSAKGAKSFSSPSGQDARDATLICFSHLRWDFVFQRPQHLMSRFAKTRQVIYWEEPLAAQDGAAPMLETRICTQSGVMVATPRLPDSLTGPARDQALKGLLETLVATQGKPIIRWYYTPMMLSFSRRLSAICTVYDCMDELANFKFAPPELVGLEKELMAQADVMFTGGYSLYEAKQHRHPNIHPFPSSVDRDHFAAARSAGDLQLDQRSLPRPRLGFYGVVDERMDLELLARVADARPNWSLVIVGPVVKIDPAALPKRANIHYLGGKDYEALPKYLGGWDAALMPFAINDSTRFISPTKTPEYLAGGRPVVSTPITDVIRHYGDLQAVQIADTPEAFVEACERAITLFREGGDWLTAADEALSQLSWDATFSRMEALIENATANAQSEAARDLAAPAIRPANLSRPFDYLVVGAGFAGSVLAERLASQLNKRVLVVDRRDHIAGNAYDEHDAGGVLMHRYGPHIFHTNSAEIADYLSQFTQWRPYEHRVLAEVRGSLVPIPINRTTLNTLYGAELATDEAAQAFLQGRAEPIAAVRTSEDVVVSQVGRELYELFFRGYTRKQWGLDPSELDRSVTARVPTRTNTDDRYFTDSFQAMPLSGYTAMFKAMLDHPNITVQTGVEFEDIKAEVVYDHLIYTGPIDEFFDHRFGKLPYRSLAFRHETLDQPWFQPVGTVNYPDEATPYTRISEYKHITGQDSPRTTITYEYPRADGDPYYPIPRPENQALFKRYEALARQQAGVTFVGRLATYRYYNMDQVVGQALATFRRIAEAQGRPRDAAEAVTRRA